MKQIGEFGPPNVEIVSFFASDPDSGDAVFSTGDEIGIDFNIPTNQANLPRPLGSRHIDIFWTPISRHHGIRHVATITDDVNILGVGKQLPEDGQMIDIIGRLVPPPLSIQLFSQL